MKRQEVSAGEIENVEKQVEILEVKNTLFLNKKFTGWTQQNGCDIRVRESENR